MSQSSRKRLPILPFTIVLGVLVAFAVGLGWGLAGPTDLGTKFRAVLAAIGQPQLEAYQSQYQTPGDKVSYLLFFTEDGEVKAGTEYLKSTLNIDVIDKTVFNRGIVISVAEPAKELIADLRKLPFVWMVLRDRPFFFCH